MAYPNQKFLVFCKKIKQDYWEVSDIILLAMLVKIKGKYACVEKGKQNIIIKFLQQHVTEADIMTNIPIYVVTSICFIL